MKVFNIELNQINDVKNFVNIVNRYDYEMDLTSGRYVVDAKSIMGIFSLDLDKPVKMNAETDDAKFIEAVKPFVASK